MNLRQIFISDPFQVRVCTRAMNTPEHPHRLHRHQIVMNGGAAGPAAPSTPTVEAALPSYADEALQLRPPPGDAGPAVDRAAAVAAVASYEPLGLDFTEPDVTLALVEYDPSHGQPLEPGITDSGFDEVLSWVVSYAGTTPDRYGPPPGQASPGPDSETLSCLNIYLVHAETGGLLH
jgi:hypothetical protein